MTEQGTDRYGAEYKRTDHDFYFKWLEQDNFICNICHGTGAKIEIRYVTRNYESARRKGKICKTLQAHGHSFRICPICIDNLVKKSGGLVKVLVKADMKGEPMSDLISRQAAIEVITQLLNEFEEMCAKIREENGDESVCGLCEYDGAYVGESGDWCNECPGFNREDCFEMREDYRQGWINQIIARAKTNEAERGSK